MDFENISMNEVMDKYYQTNGILIDVRDPEEYEEGHLPGAINVPYSMIERGYFMPGKQRKLIIYCDRGSKSMLASKYLARQGYSVINVIGGFIYYQGELEN